VKARSSNPGVYMTRYSQHKNGFWRYMSSKAGLFVIIESSPPERSAFELPCEDGQKILIDL
jgi:hypothetical protein